MNRLFVATICTFAWAPWAHAQDHTQGRAQDQAVVVQQIFTSQTTSSGQPLKLPQASAEVVVSTYRIAPGARLPVHKHPFARYAYVQSGTLRVSNMDTGTALDFRAGDFIVEAIDQWHYGETVGSEPVSLLVIDQIETGRKSTILKGP